MTNKRLFSFIMILFVVLSCKKDDDGGFEVVPPRLLSEVITEDAVKIKEYLETHFYNYEEFENPPVDFDFRIKLDTIAGDNVGKTPLISQMEAKTVTIRSEEFGADDEETVEHTYYYLPAKEGLGVSPSVADSTYVRYEGSLLNGHIFDGSTESAIWFDLARIQGPLQGARGFSEGIPNFKAGGVIEVNPDGTYEVKDYGVGLIIFPSALGYYNSSQGTIPEYSPLIFKIDLFAVNEADHDGDGIPSIMEDVNNDGYLYNDNTDEDNETELRIGLTPNFLDDDDDDDGTPTREEIEIVNGIIITPDTDNDGIPDYLDKDNK